MGIRFQCPNGHKLHVKAFLAGKRAICPQCDAKVLVPSAGDVANRGQAIPTEPSATETPARPEPILPDAPPTASIAYRTKLKRRQKRRVQITLLLTAIVVVLLVALVAVVLR